MVVMSGWWGIGCGKLWLEGSVESGLWKWWEWGNWCDLGYWCLEWNWLNLYGDIGESVHSHCDGHDMVPLWHQYCAVVAFMIGGDAMEWKKPAYSQLWLVECSMGTWVMMVSPQLLAPFSLAMVCSNGWLRMNKCRWDGLVCWGNWKRLFIQLWAAIDEQSTRKRRPREEIVVSRWYLKCWWLDGLSRYRPTGVLSCWKRTWLALSKEM